MEFKVDRFSSTSPLPETKVADVCEIGESRLRSVTADDAAMSEDRARLCFYLFPLARPDPQSVVNPELLKKEIVTPSRMHVKEIQLLICKELAITIAL